MNKIKKFIITTIVLGIILTLIYNSIVQYKKFVSRKIYNEIKNNPQVYVYDTTNGSLNPAMYIESLSYKRQFINYFQQLKEYHKKLEKGLIEREFKIVGGDTVGYTIPVYITFPINYMEFPAPVYFLGYTGKDSLLAEVVDFNTDCWGYVRGYVYRTDLHNVPPSIEKLNALNKGKENVLENNHLYKKPSRYGIQCW